MGLSTSHRIFALQIARAGVLLACLWGLSARAQEPPAGSPQFQGEASQVPPHQYSSSEIVNASHQFFGGMSKDIGLVVEKATAQWGQPNGYILGEEAGGAFIGGLRYGDGTLYTRNAGDVRVFWQGPTIGVDAGGDGARTMMLVYSLPRANAIFDQFNGVAGAAYVIAGFGLTALASADEGIIVVPIRSGVGLRLGYNVGYLKFTSAPTWNPF
ncbi:MAG TPA: DUF1134 domain-containing protein [Xanthobacteraceae bacterium]|jgi:hypothetical protein